MEERSELNEEAEEMAMLSFGTTGNATTYHNRANILYPSEKKRSTEKWTRIRSIKKKKSVEKENCMGDLHFAH